MTATATSAAGWCRADLLSEFGAQKDGWGLRLSAAAWYDQRYQRANDHDSALSVNHGGTAANQVTAGTHEVAGRKAEMLDWFVFCQQNLDSHALTFRLGQHSLIWGTSLFFGMNGMAKGMAPIDVCKHSTPGTQDKETTIPPVPQLSTALQLTDATSVEAFVRFKYRPTRLQPSGSYLNSADMLGDGAERMFIGTPRPTAAAAAACPSHSASTTAAWDRRAWTRGNARATLASPSTPAATGWTP